jgi:hypothetical protein
MVAGWVLTVIFAGLAYRFWSRIGYFRVERDRLRRLVKTRVRFLELAREARRGIGGHSDGSDDDPFGVEDPTVPDVRRK